MGTILGHCGDTTGSGTVRVPQEPNGLYVRNIFDMILTTVYPRSTQGRNFGKFASCNGCGLTGHSRHPNWDHLTHEGASH